MFAEIVLANRRRLGVTQDELAAAAGVSVRTIRKIEAGRIGSPRPATVQLLADAFGLAGADRERFCQTAAGAPADQPTSSHAPMPGPPRQLPAPPRLFTGRTLELAVLEHVHHVSTVVVCAIDGMAGVGKTALAVQAAHRIANRYPDGQLFVDLHGYTQGMAPFEPADALDQLLRALDIPGTEIPLTLDEKAALYRTRLAGKRMLIVLDNAVTEAQVVSLLPGASDCLVLVTSRGRLAGLDPTHTLSLDILPRPDAVELFTRATSERRLAEQPPEQLVELVELCGRLPLAIRIAAARLRSHPTWSPSHLVDRLRDQQHRLDELVTGQRGVTAALDLSYQHLSPDQQQTYQLLGRHPGLQFDAYATAALLGSTVLHASRMLDHLLDAHLLQEPTPGRYRFHDLTRAHAAHTATRNQSPPDQSAALERLLDHYRHVTALAMEAAYPHETDQGLETPPASSPHPDLSDTTTALGWLDTELPNVLATAKYAVEHHLAAHILQLSAALHPHLRTRGRYHDAEALHQQASSIARATSDQLGQLNALLGLGDVRWWQGRYTQAADHFEQALQLARSTGYPPGELKALLGLGYAHWLQGRQARAADHFEQALQLAHTTGSRSSEMSALIGLGHIDVRQGQYARAADRLEQALQLARTTGNRPGELDTLVGLGDVHRRQGRHAQAIDHYRRLLELARASGDRDRQFEAWQGLGRLWHATGNPDKAIVHHQQALVLAGELGQPVDQARAHDGLAHAHHARNQQEQARSHWQSALDILTGLGVDHTDDEETTVAAMRAHLAALDEWQTTASTL